MAMHFEFRVTVEIERESGMFASRDDLGGQIQDAINDANPGSLTGDAGGEFVTDSWDVEEVTPAKPVRKVRR